MSAFGQLIDNFKRPNMGAKLPLYTTESLSGWLYKRISFVIDGVEISGISLI